MSKLHVETSINGEAKEFLCEADQSLLDVLRDHKAIEPFSGTTWA